jgi:hypothetical protein
VSLATPFCNNHVTTTTNPSWAAVMSIAEALDEAVLRATDQ